MSRGEEQKPVTDAYRTNWETVFRKGGYGELSYAEETEKAPPVKTEPCKECRGEGKVWFEDPQHGHAMSNRCSVCGGQGFIPVED